MTETTPDLLPLPTVAVITLPMVKGRLGIAADDSRRDVEISEVIDPVDLLVRRLPVADEARGAEAWPADIVLGAVMLGARLHRRRNSPDGVSAFGDQGPIYVQRNDPDIAQLLQLGDYARPAVG